MSNDLPPSQNLFKTSFTKAKLIQGVFFWMFRIATYLIIAAASYLFLKVAYEGSITLFQGQESFVNWRFLSESPQTLYVWEWDEPNFTDEQKEALAAEKERIENELLEKEAEFAQAIADAKQNESATRTRMNELESQLKAKKKELADVTKKERRLYKQLERADKVYRKAWTKGMNGVDEHVKAEKLTLIPEEEAPESTWKTELAAQPEIANAFAKITSLQEDIRQAAETHVALDKEISALNTELADQRDALPASLEELSESILRNLEASLEWPSEDFYTKRDDAVAALEAKYEERIGRATEKFDQKVLEAEEAFEKRYARELEQVKRDAGDEMSEADQMAMARAGAIKERQRLNKMRGLRKDNLARMEAERDEKIQKARSIEVGDLEYRGVYKRQVDAVGIDPKSFSYSGGGIFPAIVGTVLLVLGSMFIALTLGILSAVYLSEYAKPGTFLNSVRLSILNLAGVPSIVFGLFGLGMFVLFFDWNVSLLAGCFTLAFMVLPVIITASEESLRAIPQGFREGSLALGATKWTSIRTNVLPYALPGILTSSVLGVARVAGETAPIMFTAAYAMRDNLPWEGLSNPFDFFFQGVMALPYHIYVVSSKIPQNEYTERMQYGTAFVFLVIVAGIALTSILLRIRMRKKYKW